MRKARPRSHSSLLPCSPAARGAVLLATGTLGFSSALLAQEPAPEPAPATAPATAPETTPARAAFFCPDQDAAERTVPRFGSTTEADEEIDLSTEEFSIDRRGKGRVSGGVEIRQGDRRIVADSVDIDPDSNAFDVEGNVEYSDPSITVRGRAGRYSNGAGEFNDAQFEMPLQPARGAAESMSFDRAGVLELQGVSYTTCPPGSTDWQIRAKRITLDTATQNGTGHGAQVRFRDIPILYLPWISFPLGPARKSGFLFPSIGNSSRGGLQISVPYYLNLAPNYDLALQPTGYSRRGIDYGAIFRYLTGSSRGSLDGNYLPGDDLYGEDRNRFHLESRTHLPRDWQLTLEGTNVSDTAYFEDFSQGTEGTSVAFLPRLAHLTYRGDAVRAGVLARNYQTLDQALAPLDRPYTELPRIYADAGYSRGDWRGFDVGFGSEAVNFERSTGVTGWRLDVEPRAGLRIDGPGYFAQPAVSLRHTRYELEDSPAGESATRTLPIASFDTGLLFERSVGRDRSRVTLEPRLLYLYAPYRYQDDLPLFDTGVPDLNLVELFRTNRYVGADRVGDANQVSVGVTSRIFGTESGVRHLSATLGQTFYFDAPRVALPEELPLDPSASDFVAQVEVRAFRDWSVDLGVQWDHELTRPEKSEVRVQYRPDGRSVVNLGYRFQRDRLEQAEVSAAWPIASHWNLYGRVLYSLRDEESIETFAGLQYGSCCWGVRAVARRYVSARTGERDTGIYVQLELKGLSNVGIAADAFLERAIRGYSPRASQSKSL